MAHARNRQELVASHTWQGPGTSKVPDTSVIVRKAQSLAPFCFRRGLTSILIVILLAWVLRAMGLDFQPLWWDEGYSLYVSTMDIPSMVARTAEDIHPPLYYALLHLWIVLAGSKAVAVRMFSVASGIVTIPLLYLVGRRLFGSTVGILAALIVAVSPFHVYYSQEVRMYGLETALGLLSVYLMSMWLNIGAGQKGPGTSKVPGPWLLCGYVLVTSAAMYTHYYAAFVPIFQTIFVLVACRRAIARWLMAQAVLLALYVPWLVYTASRLTGYVAGKVAIEQYAPVDMYTFFERHLAALGLGHLPDNMSGLYWAGGFFFLLAVLGLIGHKIPCQSTRCLALWKCQAPAAGILFLALYLFIPLGLAYIVNLLYPFAPYGFERLLLFVAPAYYLLMGLGLARLKEFSVPLWGVALSVVLLLCGLSLYGFYTVARYPEDDYRPLLGRMRALARPEDAVICLYPWQIGYFRAYWDHEPPHLYAAFEVDWPSRTSDPGLIGRYCDGLLAHHRRLWFPAHQTEGRILEGEIESYLSRHYYPIFTEWANAHTRLLFYAAADRLRTTSGEVNFDHKLRLVEGSLARGPFEAGWGVIGVDLLWQKSGHLDGPYSIGLHLTDEEGTTWGQRDSEPVGGLYPFSAWHPDEQVRERHGLLVPAGTPPGLYQVRLSVAQPAAQGAPAHGRSLDVIDRNLIPQGVEATLGTVEVVPPERQPPLEALNIQRPLEADLTDAQSGFTTRLLGYNINRGPFAPGDEVGLTLFWQIVEEAGQDYTAFTQFQKDGKVWTAEEEQYPASRWRAGEFIRAPQTLLLPADLPPGDYHLVAGLYRPEDGERLRAKSGQDQVELQVVQVAGGRDHNYQRPAISRPLAVRLGEGAALIGYDLERQEVRPGQTLRLTLFWQALAPMEHSYTVFVHLLDADEHTAGQIDTIPGLGTLPTTGWVPGEYLEDEYQFQVKTQAQPGPHLIEVGMYDAKSGERLPAWDEDENRQLPGDRVLLKEVIRVIR